MGQLVIVDPDLIVEAAENWAKAVEKYAQRNDSDLLELKKLKEELEIKKRNLQAALRRNESSESSRQNSQGYNKFHSAHSSDEIRRAIQIADVHLKEIEYMLASTNKAKQKVDTMKTDANVISKKISVMMEHYKKIK